MPFPGSLYSQQLLDNFTRANENPLSDGGRWSGPVVSGHSQLQLLSNAATGVITTGNNSYWNAAFAGDQEAWAAIGAVPLNGNSVGVVCRVQNPGNATTLATYAFLVVMVSATTAVRHIYKIIGTTFTSLAADAAAFTPAVGDAVGGQCIGTSIALWYKPSGGAWAQDLSITDASVAGTGYAGAYVDDTTGKLTSFSGGPLGGPGMSVQAPAPAAQGARVDAGGWAAPALSLAALISQPGALSLPSPPAFEALRLPGMSGWPAPALLLTALAPAGVYRHKLYKAGTFA